MSDTLSTNREHSRPRGRVSLWNPLTPQEIAGAGIYPVILFYTFLPFRPRGDILTPDPPELQVLIPSASHDHVTGRAESTEQDTRVVGISDLCDAVEGRVGVNHNRVGRIAVSG